MRIAYMVGGFSSTDAILLNKFVQYGLDTHVVYTRPAPADYEVLNKVTAHWIDLDRLNYLPKSLRWSVFAWETISAVRRIEPDVILSQGIQAHGLFSVLSRIRPVLLMPWGSDWAIDAHKNILMRLLSRFVVNHADLVQIDCETGKKTILELSGGKLQPEDIWVFPQGIELDIFKPQPDARNIFRQQLGWADKKILIMTRQLKAVYGVDVFIKALSPIIQRDKDVRAVIVGDGPLENELKELSLSSGLGDMVKFTGRLDRRDLFNYLNAADIYVSTSYSDGTSLSLLEALAVGLPAVVTDVPANLVKDGYNGFIATRGSSQSVSEALLKLGKMDELRRCFGRRSFDVARERADWDKNFDQFMEMFHLLVDRRKSFAKSINSQKSLATINQQDGNRKVLP